MKLPLRPIRRISSKDLFELLVCIALAGLFVLLSSGTAFGQGNVGINNPTPHAKSLLDLTSSDKGLLTPRMTAAQRTAMFPLADATGKGMLVYQTDGTQGFYYYDGAAWVMVQSGGAGWGLLGNAGTDPTTNFIGTTDNQALAFRANNTEHMRIAPNGNVGIGYNAPNFKLDVVGTVPGGQMAALRNMDATGYSTMTMFSNTGTTQAWFGVSNPANCAIAGTGTASPFILATSNFERMRIDAAGKVGIGNTAPVSNLQVTRAAAGYAPNANAVITAESSGSAFVNVLSTSGETGVLFGTSGTAASGGILYNSAGNTNGLQLRTGGNVSRMRISDIGEVTIGDNYSWPGYRLGVVANSTNPAGAFQNTNANGYSGLHFINNTGVARAHIGAGNASSPNWVNMGYAGTYTAHPFVLTTNDLERMRIDVNGNVGIGTSAPVSNLQVTRASAGYAPNANAVITAENSGPAYVNVLSGTGETGVLFGSGGAAVGAGVLHNTGFMPNGLELRAGGNTRRMSMANNGYTTFGDNTHWPAMRLGAVNNDAHCAVGSLNTNTSGWSGYSANRSDFGGSTYLGFGNTGHATMANTGFTGTGSAHPFAFVTGNTERMRIAVDGKVGIGTTAPTAELEVNGFTKHGTNAPAIKQLELAGTTAATEGTFVDIAHGLTASKIIDVRVLIEYTAGSWITTGYTINPEYLADYVIGATNIRLYNHNGSSGSILSKPVKVLITYKA